MAEERDEAVDDAEDDSGEARVKLERDQDLLGRANSKFRAKLKKDFDEIHKAFTDAVDRTDDQMDFWDCYNCVLNDHQFYTGQAEIYVPLIRVAIDALVTRYSNQLFPPGGHYVEAITTDGSQPNAELAIVEHYIRDLKLKTNVCKPMLRNGYIEGQVNLYVDWGKLRRRIVSRETHGVPLGPDLDDIEAPGEEIEDVKVEDIVLGMPAVKVLHDSDVMVLPTTADSVEEALENGGSATIVRRWTKAKIEKMIDDGHIEKREGDELLKAMEAGQAGSSGNVPHDVEKGLREHVGIKGKGSHAVVWETWKMYPLGEGGYSEKGERQLCRVYFGATGDKKETPLGAKRNPNWNDRCPLLSAPLKKVAGVFKGESWVAPIATLQYEANDAANEGADAATYAAGPIVARDPEKSTANLMFNIGAVWDVAPKDVEFMQFPDLTDRAIKRIEFCKQAIFEALSVNPGMVPHRPAGAKANQAQIAQEQQVDILNATEEAAVAAEGVLTPLAEWFVDLDHQHRDEDLTVKMYGELGVAAEMETVPPLRNRAGVQFNWVGAEISRINAAVAQQGTALLNVARGMGQQLKEEGLQLRIGPALQRMFSITLGPTLARQTLLDMKSQLTMEAETENELMAEGHDVQVHMLDNDPEHIQKHQQALQMTGDPHGTIRVHIGRHLLSMQTKAVAAMQKAQGAQGVPGGGGQPGVAGTPRGGAPPRMGAQPAGPQLVAKAPPGAVHPDQMPRAGAVPMPRRM